MYQLKAVEYPNNEIRLTTAKLPAPKDLLSQCETHETEPENPPLDIRQKSETRTHSGLGGVSVGWGMSPRNRVFSRRGRNKLMRAGGVFTKEGMKPQQVLFLTGTLPGSTPAAFQNMADWSGYLVHSLKAWINKYVPGKCDFYVWEHQKRGALHLHYAVYCPDRAVGERIKEGFPSYWIKKLKEISLETGIDMFDTGKGYSWLESVAEQNQVAQWVEKDVSRYLAKYCSKTAPAVTRNVTGNHHSPSQWYGISRPLLALLKKHTIEHIFYTAKQGEVRKVFDKLYGYLANLADICHIYKCDVTGLPQSVAYNSHWDLTTLWLRKMTNQQNLTSLQSQSVKHTMWVNSYLTVIAKRYSITPSYLQMNSSPMSAQSLEKLYGHQQLNIAEAMDLIHALRWNSWYKFRSRHEPQSLKKDVEMLDNLYHRILTLRVQWEMDPELPLCELLLKGIDKVNP